MQARPIIETHGGIHVVRDDLYPGGTKARFIPQLFEGVDELVYASPAEGGAQFSIAFTARALGKRATIFVARRQLMHPRYYQIKAIGAHVIEVMPGYLNVIQARAAAYAAANPGARLAPFGLDLPIAIDAIAAAAGMIDLAPDEVWCAAGSGTLARGLARAWPGARLHAVQVGRPVMLPGAFVHDYGRPFGRRAMRPPPFPSDWHYDAKAWELCAAWARGRTVLFWNVLGPPAEAPDQTPARAEAEVTDG